ncbi:MAG: hypothetical protein EHM39_02190 [Chloroflexi bacterium]|nr:MAG: hypothetical protein EHM39_02190 [Chloroflexota bacterium]
MDDATHEKRPRASLRGKGREILLGQEASDLAGGESTLPQPERPPVPSGSVDATSLALTPEEAAALLDFSPTSPAYEAALPPVRAESAPAAPAHEIEPSPAIPEDEPPAWWAEMPAEPEAYAAPPDFPPVDGAVDLADAWMDVEDTSGELPDAVETVDTRDMSADFVDGVHGAVPLAERGAGQIADDDNVPYETALAVDDLVPIDPEAWSDVRMNQIEQPVAQTPFARLERFREQATTEDEGGLVVPEGTVEQTDVPGISDPFEPSFQRPPSDALFARTDEPNQELLKMLVDDGRIRKLSQQIEALQEELAQDVYSDRGTADEYQKELLRASSLLLGSRANYDDARAIVYRVRTDMNRRRKIEFDIRRYRPLLLNYYVGWGIALVVLFLLRELFTGVTEAVGVEVFAALYYPMLFGIVGALISGYLTLERHTTRLRDFDPIHVSWYLFNPLLGGVMGLLMFLLASIANEDLLQQTASDGERAITNLLCVVAGMNQNNVLRQLNDLLDRFGRGSKR